jgi:hypothetical protein
MYEIRVMQLTRVRLNVKDCEMIVKEFNIDSC